MEKRAALCLRVRPRQVAALRHMPGALLVAIVAPIALAAGMAGIVALTGPRCSPVWRWWRCRERYLSESRSNHDCAHLARRDPRGARRRVPGLPERHRPAGLPRDAGQS